MMQSLILAFALASIATLTGMALGVLIGAAWHRRRAKSRHANDNDNYSDFM